jgi:hypothetical protein
MNGRTTIKVAGKDIGLWFGMDAAMKLGERASAGTGSHVKFISDMIMAGHENDCIVKGVVEPLVKYDQVYEWVEDAVLGGDKEAGQEIEKASACYLESRAKKHIDDTLEAAEASKKKPLRGKK